METICAEKAKVASALARIIAGEELDDDTLYGLAEIESEEGRQALLDAAATVTAKFCTRKFDFCSIVNARSGHCSENCKWCAQSAHFATDCHNYEIVDRREALDAARYNADQGIGRFSLVASGKATRGKALEQMCDILAEVAAEGRNSTCASLGLLNKEELQRLWDSGTHRYHCNLETAPSYFGKLCSTHSQDEKIATIEAARAIGFEICSGGIIGMGESRRQRVELAITLRKVKPASIPINVLCPIAGTPLENTPLISEEEILLTVALFRMAHPAVTLRFAGGRARMSRRSQLEALRIGINGAIAGDLLTTVGSTIAQDKELVTEAGYEY